MGTHKGGTLERRGRALSALLTVVLVLSMLPANLAWGNNDNAVDGSADAVPGMSDAATAASLKKAVSSEGDGAEQGGSGETDANGPGASNDVSGDAGASGVGNETANGGDVEAPAGENEPAGTDANDSSSTGADGSGNAANDATNATLQPGTSNGAGQADDLAASDLAAPVAPVVRSGDTGAPNTLNFALSKLAGGITSSFDPSKAVLGDLTEMRMRITYQQATGSSGNTLTITLPDYYSFKPIPQTSYYTAGAPTSVNDGVNNQVVLAMSEVTGAGNPPTWQFDIDIQLNRDSIVGTTKEAAWREGTWNPNDGACEFSVQYNANVSAVAKQVITVTTKDYPGILTEAAASPQAGLNQSVTLHATGSAYPNTAWLAFSYAYPDVLTYGTLDFSEFTTTITLPEYFEIKEYVPSTNNDTASTKFLSASQLNVKVAPDNQSVEITVSDDGSDPSKMRFVGSFSLQPIERFRNNAVQNGSVADDPVNGVLLPSGASYDVQTSATDKQGNRIKIAQAVENPDGSISYASKIMIEEYTQGNRFTLSPAGDIDADDPTKIIYSEVSAGTSGDAWALAKLANSRLASPITEPDFDGAGSVLTAKFDENIQVSSIIVGATNGYSQDSIDSEEAIREAICTLDDGSILGPITPQADGTCSFQAPSGRYITGFSTTYDKFVYIADKSIATHLKYSIPAVNKTTGAAFAGGEDLEMSYTLAKSASGETLAEGKNYLRIKGDVCPNFKLMAESRQTPQAADFAALGTYSQEETAWTAGFALTTDFVGLPTWSDTGDPVYVDDAGKATAADGHRYTVSDAGVTPYRSGYLGLLDNPAFTHVKSPANYDANAYTARGILFNGTMMLHKIMGDGDWKIEVTSQTAKRAYAGDLPVTTTFDLPAFTEDTLEVNLHDAAQFANALGFDECIMDAKVYHVGALDLSPLSNGYDGSAKGVAVDKTFYQLQRTSYAIDPLTGIPTGNYAAVNGASTLSSWNNYIAFENCTHVDKRHTWAKGGLLIGDSASVTSLASKGAEPVDLTWPTTTYEGTIQQDATKTISITVAMQASMVSGTEVWSTGGEAAYFALTEQTQKYLSFSNAKFDGLAADMSIVEIGGNKYLKIVNPSRTAYERPTTKGSGATFSFNYGITVDVTALPITPVSNISVFDASYLEFGPAQTYYYIKDGIALKGSLRPSGSQSYTGGTAVDSSAYTYGGTATDDPLSLYPGAAVTEHHWVTSLATWKIAPVQAATQGVILNPGVEGTFGKDQIDVKPWQESTMKAGITLAAGNIPGGMKELHSTIKIPRAGDMVTDPVTGEAKTTSVDMYLSGPLSVTVPFNNSASTAPVVTYSLDGGATFISAVDMQAKVDAGQAKWGDVTHVDLFVSNIAQNDGGQLVMPLTTQNGTDKGLTGEAYLEAVFTTKSADATSNRLSTYTFGPYDLTGRVWNDADKNGNIDNGETFSETTLYLYKNYGEAGEELLDTVTSDAATGNYIFTTGYYQNLTLVADLPAGTTVTPHCGAGFDNKYQSDGEGHGKVWLDVEVTRAQSDLHMGVIGVSSVTIGGANVATAVTGKKTLGGDRANTDITAGQFTFAVTPDAANPPHGAEDVPATITHEAGAADGAALDFTGVDGWTFNKEGIYRYTLTETAGAAPGFTYDAARYEVEIRVTLDQATLDLQAAVTVLKDGTAYSAGFQAIDFANSYGKPWAVTYNGNGNTAGTVPADAQSPYDDGAAVMVLGQGDLARAGHQFVSWNLSPDGNDTAYSAGDTFAITANTTLYANWQKKAFQVMWATSEGGTIAPDSATETVLYEGFATTAVVPTPQGDGVSGDEYAFTGWSYRYLPDGMADSPENYEQGTVADYKTVAIKGNVTFTAQFSKKPFVNANASNGFVKIADGATAPSIADPKLTTDRVEYNALDAAGETASIALEARTHYHLAKVTVADLYGHEKIIYTNAVGGSADTDFTMESSVLAIETTFGADPAVAGSLKISNVKNSLNVQVTFEEDPKYDVSFYAMAGDPSPFWVNADLYESDKQGAAPATDPVRPGWTFAGWSYDGTDDAAQAYDPDALIADHDVNVYAVWIGNIYHVNYDLAGGEYSGASTLPAKPVAWDDANLLPANEPTREGYDFTSWTKDGAAITAADTYESLVTNDTVRSITLTANWAPHSFEVAFDKNAAEATGSMANQAFTYDVEQALAANEFAWQGYEFAGWSLTPTGSVLYADEASVKNLTADDGDTVTLYAQYNERGDTPYAVEHYIQKADGAWEVGETENLTARTNAVVNAVPKSRTAAGFEKQVHDATSADAVVSGTVANDGSLVLKLYYRLASQVTFDAQGGQPEAPTQEVLWGNTATKPTDPAKTGYVFTGWAQGGTDGGAAGAAAWNFADPVNADLALTAAYDANTYTVTFVPGGDNVEGTMADQAFTYDAEQALAANAFSRTGYTFSHWVVVPDPKGRAAAVRGDTFADGETVLNLSADVDGAVFLQAVWTADSVADPDAPTVLSTAPGSDSGKGGFTSAIVRTGDGILGAVAPLAGGVLMALLVLLLAARKRKADDR